MSIKPSSSRVPSLFHFLCESLVFYRSVPQLHLYNVRTRSESPQLFIYALSLSLCLTFHSFLCKLSKTSYPEHSMKFSLQKLWTWTYTTQFLLQCIMNIIFLKHWNSWMELPNSVDFQFKPISSVKLRWALQGSWLFFWYFCFLLFHRFMALYVHTKMTVNFQHANWWNILIIDNVKMQMLWDSSFIPVVFTLVLPSSRSNWLPENLQGLALGMEVNKLGVTKWIPLDSSYCSSREGIFVSITRQRPALLL